MTRKTNLIRIIREVGQLNFAVVGLGEVGLTHCDEYNKMHHKVVAVAEVSEEVVEKNKAFIKGELELKDGQVFTGENALRDMLEVLDTGRLNGVSVCTPPYARREIVSELLDEGLDILVEIPLAHTLEDARYILEHVNGNITAMSYPWGNVCPVSVLKKLVHGDSHDLGKVKEARIEQTHNIDYLLEDDWRSEPDKGGGPVSDHMVHLINYLHKIFGEIESVRANIRSKSIPSEAYTIRTTFRFVDGYVVRDSSTYGAHGTTGQTGYEPHWKVECQFEGGKFQSEIEWKRDFPVFRLSLDGQERSRHWFEHCSDEVSPQELNYEGQGLWEKLLLHSVIGNFAMSLQSCGPERVKPYCNLWDGYKDLKVALKIREAIKSGREEKIDY